MQLHKNYQAFTVKMKLKISHIIILILFLTSCSYKYRYVYKSHVENTNIGYIKDTSFTIPLCYQDSVLQFTFFPKPNGIVFKIQNKSNENVFLLWDKSYFINPNNNSSKALNTDILNTQIKILDKQSNESIIPKKGELVRFTTSAKNIVTLEQSAFTTYYLSPDVTVKKNFYNKIYLHNPYWIVSSEVPYKNKKDGEIQHNIEMTRVKNHVEDNNSLGIGFTFRIKDKEVDYDFKIIVDNVLVYKENEETLIYDCVDTLNIQSN